MQAYLEIQARAVCYAAIAGSRQHFATINPFTGLHGQRLVRPVQAHESIAVIDDHQKPRSPQPIGEYYLPGMNSSHRRAFANTDCYALAGKIAISVAAAKMADEWALGWRRQGALLFLERRHIGEGSYAFHGSPDFFDKRLQFRLVNLQSLQFGALRGNIGIEFCQRGLATGLCIIKRHKLLIEVAALLAEIGESGFQALIDFVYFTNKRAIAFYACQLGFGEHAIVMQHACAFR